MRIKWRRQVLVDRSELFVVTRAQVLSAWCPGCNRQVDLIDLQKAARLYGASPEAIQGWIEMGKVHSQEKPEGQPVVCLASLLAGGEPSPPPQHGRRACMAIKDFFLRFRQ